MVADVIWRPNRGETWVLLHGFYKRRQIVGVVSDDPSLSLTDGTSLIVGAVDLVNTNAYQRLVLTGPNVVITNEAPLTLAITDAPAGATVWNYDLILFFARLSD